jgi:hypothetical protein
MLVRMTGTALLMGVALLPLGCGRGTGNDRQAVMTTGSSTNRGVPATVAALRADVTLHVPDMAERQGLT